MLRRAVAGGIGAALARAALNAILRNPRSRTLDRTNFHGRTVSLAGGPAFALGATVGAALGAPTTAAAAAATTAGLTAGAVGCYDDIVGGRPDQKAAKGFAGHLGALSAGRVTSGLVKIAGVGAAGLAAAALLHRDASVTARRPHQSRTARTVDVLLGAGVIAGTANLVNLLDLRPGRAIKAGALLGAPLSAGRSGGLASGPVAAAAALAKSDLDEQIMLGDAGANAYGALLGVALAARTGIAGRAGTLAVLGALMAASEKVSFTQVIQRTPVLRELDALGRRP